MKTIKYIIISLLIACAFASCADQLDTEPTGGASKEKVFENTDNAFAAVNGIYRSFYRPQWTENNLTVGWSYSYPTENFGLSSVNIAADIMGEDMVEYASGSAWFWYDYLYWVRTEYNNTSDRPYVWWNMFYKWIANANYIITFLDAAEGSEQDKNNLFGQAYALRAFSYFYLAQFYQRTYIGHENDPGVPVYTEASTIQTEGKGRGVLAETYTQINEDIDKAIIYFTDASSQRNKSHIDLYVAYGMKARFSLVQQKWADAANAAAKALEKPGLTLMSANDALAGFNNISNNEWMWASDVIADQASTWYSFFGHMDATAGYHATTAQKCVGSWLYNMIGANDVRKSWFLGPNPDPAAKGDQVSYCQRKFVDKSTAVDGDLVYMRAAEMYLALAEAKCQLGEYQAARDALTQVVGYKDPDFGANLATKTDSKDLTLKSTESTSTTTLMDEIIVQRRIELWGEGFRIFDIMRLKTGFKRTFANSNHTNPNAYFDIDDPESWEWIMLIPQKEFDGNPSMDINTDQNQ